MKGGMINAALRMAAMQNRAGAILITGTDKIRSGFGNGDCVMMDFDHAVFALSDSAERYSRASRDFLERLHGSLVSHGVPGDIAAWRDCANDLYAAQEYRHKATFSCAALRKAGESVVLTALNGGDSVIAALNRTSGTVQYLSRPDMCFAGRSKTISHVAEIKLGDDAIVALFSDGLFDIAKLINQSAYDLIVRGSRNGVHRIAETVRTIVEEQVNPTAEYDDVSVLLLDPVRCIQGGNGALIMGGSTPQEEHRYQHNIRRVPLFDRWMELDEIVQNDVLARECGIRILH
jgi:hypothetical protein